MEPRVRINPPNHSDCALSNRANVEYTDVSTPIASNEKGLEYDWSRHMEILNRQLASTGAYVAGNEFSLADIPIGLSVNRWFETPLAHPDFPAVSDYYERLSHRPGYLLHGRNGTP